MHASVEGGALRYQWSGIYDGQEFSASGELKRQGARK